jgi:hypothetical protein
MITLQQIINRTDNHLDFWQELEQSGGRLLFEEYMALYLKASLPGEIYWLGEDVVPSHIAEKYKFEKLLKGKRSMGGDIIQIHNDRAVAYEGKWFDKKETINFEKVANKLQAINKTKIDTLIFGTNARKQSDAIIDFADEVGFLFLDHWMRAEVYDTVKNYINNKEKIVYAPMQPRDKFFEKALIDLDQDVKKLNKPNDLRIMQQWPASAGKGSFPRLAYDRIFEPRIKKPNPLNGVVNPRLAVLKTNLVKQIRHDIALGNDAVHIIFAGDVTKSAKDTEELQTIRTLAKVFKDKIEFVKFIKSHHNQTIWIHTTAHSYHVLAKILKGQNKKFNFLHIDEVHRMIQPDHSVWTACLDETHCKVDVRFMTSANKRRAKGKGAKWSMDDPTFSDISVNSLKEKDAVEKKYKRKTVLINCVYGIDYIKRSWLELIEKNGQPLLKLKGTNQVVPMSWYMSADALIHYRIEHQSINHTKLTFNRMEELRSFKEFFDIIKPRLLKDLVPKQSEIYRRLLKAPFIIADTDSNSTVKILKEVEAVPDTYRDSFIGHAFLLGEGWDPANGWIDSNMFVSPTHSEIRIYQDVNRGARIGDGSKTKNPVLQVFLGDDDNDFNEMFATIRNVGCALEIGEDDITEQVVFKTFKKLPKGKKNNRQTGSDDQSYYDHIDADFFHKAFDVYIKEGRWHKFGQAVNDIFKDYWQMYEERMAWLHVYQKGLIYDQLIQKYNEYFTNYGYMAKTGAKTKKVGPPRAKYYEKLGTVIKGDHHLLSNDNFNLAIDLPIKFEQIKDDYIKDLVKEWVNESSRIAYPMARQIGKLNSTGSSPVHQLNLIKQKIDDKFKFSKWTTKKTTDYPSFLSNAIKDKRNDVVKLWNSNFQIIIDELVKILTNPKIKTFKQLYSVFGRSKIFKTYYTTPSDQIIDKFFQPHLGAKNLWTNCEKAGLDVSKLKINIEPFKQKVKDNKTISESHKQKLRTYHLGKKRSDQAIANIRKAAKTRKKIDYEKAMQTRKKNGVWIVNLRKAQKNTRRAIRTPKAIYQGVCEAAKAYNVDPAMIAYWRHKKPKEFYYV